MLTYTIKVLNYYYNNFYFALTKLCDCFFFGSVVGERPYHCKHCDKSFATTISLKTHTYIHTGEKPHKCPHCPKTFATSSKLGRHIVTHSEQRPFTCDHCPKSFNRSGEVLYSCSGVKIIDMKTCI